MLHLLSLWNFYSRDSPNAMKCPTFSLRCVSSAVLSGERPWPLVGPKIWLFQQWSKQRKFYFLSLEMLPTIGMGESHTWQMCFPSGSVLLLNFSHFHHPLLPPPTPLTRAYSSFFSSILSFFQLFALKFAPRPSHIMFWMTEGWIPEVLSAGFWQGLANNSHWRKIRG